MRLNHRSVYRIISRLKCQFLVLCLLCVAVAPADAAIRLIVRVQGGAPVLQAACILLGCNVQYPLGDDQGQVFLVTAPLNLTANLLLNVPGVLNVELDSIGATTAATQAGVPAALYDATPVNYYGTTVRQGYVTQPAVNIIGLPTTQSAFGVRGSGIVAVIDTGVDSAHPALANALIPGYDFTRNEAGAADEKGDIHQSTTAVIDQSTTAVVDQSTTAVIDSYTASQLNQPQYQAFGHGTMVAGVVRLVAPGAMIMPLKAFHADGTGYASDVIRAVYFAVRNHARILNMSFSFQTSPLELNLALNYAKLERSDQRGRRGQRQQTNRRVSGRLLRHRNGGGLYVQFRHALHVLQLRAEPGMGRRSRRRDCHVISVRHLRCNVGHVFQHAFRGWRGGPATRSAVYLRRAASRPSHFPCPVHRQLPG